MCFAAGDALLEWAGGYNEHCKIKPDQECDMANLALTTSERSGAVLLLLSGCVVSESESNHANQYLG